MTSPVKPEQQYPPGEQLAKDSRQSIYYPQCRAILQVVFENFGDPDAPKIIPVIPRSATINSNSYKEADTWSLEFDAKDLPVTPHLIRAGAVEIYLFQTRGIGQEPEVIVPGSDDVASLEGIKPCITGLFDEASVEYSDSGRSVTLDGTDYTSLFIAKQWDPKKRVRCGRSLEDAIRSLKAEVESADALEVVVDPLPESASEMPKLGEAESRSTRKKGIPFTQGKNYWDVMYGLAIRYGWILFVRNNELVLTKPQSYTKARSKVRKMAWGRNLTSLRMNRRIGKETVPIIQVRSYDEREKKVISAQYPKNPKQQPVTGLGTKKTEIKIYTVPGIRTQKRLLEVAETTYNLLARAEQEIEIETMDLKDLDGQDMIELRAGDAMTIAFEAMNTELLESASTGQRYRILTELGYQPLVAAAVALTFDRINVFKRPFRVKEATLDWSYDGGLSIQAKLQNFINIQGQEP